MDFIWFSVKHSHWMHAGKYDPHSVWNPFHVYCSEITRGYSNIGCYLERFGESDEQKNISPTRIKKNKTGVYHINLVVHEDTFDEKDEIIMMERIIRIFPSRYHTKACFFDYVDNNTIIEPILKEFGAYKEKTIRSSVLSSRVSYFSNRHQ